MGGDLVYIVSKNAFFAGPNNVAYGAAKADQAHQVRLLAAELGEFGIRVNGVNPDGVVRGSGIFAKGWGADRARTYGIPEDKLGEFYAQRTILKHEVLPEHVAAAVFALTGGDLSPDHGPPHPGRRRSRGRVPAVSGGALAAIDLGASSGRVSWAGSRTGPSRWRRSTASPTTRSRLPDGLHWDILGLYGSIVDGLRKAGASAGDLAGIAVDSWGVDYGLLDAGGSLVGIPFHYRDSRTDGVAARLEAAVSRERLYARTGTQFLAFNTLYQLAADATAGRLAGAATMALIPDLVGYWLTGVIEGEATNASTTGLFDPERRAWDTDLVDELGLPPAILGGVARAGRGARAGPGRPSRPRPGSPPACSSRTSGSHDTASAVVAVPMADERAAYVACGTWGLVGLELEAPIRDAHSRAANFTNELGVDGRIRFLRNVMGLWLLQESIRTWERAGRAAQLATLLAAAAERPAGGPTFDPNDPSLLPPGDMPARISALLVAAGAAAARRSRRGRPEHPRQPRDRVRGGRPRRDPDRRARGRRRPRRRRRQPERPALPAHGRRAGPPRRRGPRRGDGDRQPARPGPGARAARGRPRGPARGRAPLGGHPPLRSPPGAQGADDLRVKVALFITCFNDMLFPDVGRATVRLLRRLGQDVEFPEGQTCCGQMHFNTGYRADCLPLVRRFADVFAGYDAVVTPSPSCAGMVRHQHAGLAASADDAALEAAVAAVVPRVYELTEFLVDVLGVTDVGATFPEAVTLHPTCHSLRRWASATGRGGCSRRSTG